MINPTHLRIGNLIYDHSRLKLHPLEVRAIYKDGVLVYHPIAEKEWGGELNHICGIPLTEEWLLKLGFKKMDETKYPEFVIIGLSVLYSDGCCELYNNGNPIKIKCVHQLQNLYFELTGSELTLNNP